MDFLNRVPELARLDRLMASDEGGLAVVFGRRRLGKTRLLLEWSRKHGGLYSVADSSAAGVQRRYFAAAVAVRLPALADVEYGDWRGLLSRLARDAAAAGFRGPIVLDEFPYLVEASPELPSVLQQWVDHEAREARLVVAVAGSSQRMMQGLVLAREAPLYGRAQQILEVGPLAPEWLRPALGPANPIEASEMWAAWGGVPRYWELAAGEEGPVAQRIERLILDPLGPLHQEPDRLLLEEVPSATDLRPILDAIGAGAHRLSEIAARIARPATSLSRPLDRLRGIGLVRREVPFGDPEKGTKRARYRLADPFVRLWFRIVAPHRGLLASASTRTRLLLLAKHWPHLAAAAWEDLARQALAHLPAESALGDIGPWGPAGRWWWRNEPEWDLVARSIDGDTALIAETRWSARPFSAAALRGEAHRLLARPVPAVVSGAGRVVRALCVPAVAPGARLGEVLLLTGDDIFRISTGRRRVPPAPGRR